MPGGLLRPRTEAIIGAAALTALQQFNFTKAFIGANGVALNVGFTTPDPEEAAVKAVAVRRARVLGQIQPGVPVWMTGQESRFPNTPYVIFPGNVGTEETLCQVVKTLLGK